MSTTEVGAARVGTAAGAAGSGARHGSVRILVADDHTLLREALCELLRATEGFEVVAQAGSGEETVQLAALFRPDVVLLDLEMPGNDPPSTVQRLLAADPGLRIIVLSMHDGRRMVQELLSLGVHGYLHKSATRETLVSAIRSNSGARGGPRTVTLSMPPQSLGPGAYGAPGDELLSLRELQILGLVAQALSNRQIASQLGITEGTVKRHLRNVFGKLAAVSRIDAVNKASARGMLPSARR